MKRIWTEVWVECASWIDEDWVAEEPRRTRAVDNGMTLLRLSEGGDFRGIKLIVPCKVWFLSHRCMGLTRSSMLDSLQNWEKSVTEDTWWHGGESWIFPRTLPELWRVPKKGDVVQHKSSLTIATEKQHHSHRTKIGPIRPCHNLARLMPSNEKFNLG